MKISCYNDGNVKKGDFRTMTLIYSENGHLQKLRNVVRMESPVVSGNADLVVCYRPDPENAATVSCRVCKQNIISIC